MGHFSAEAAENTQRAAEKISVGPNSHPINLHLLRKHSGAVRTADKVSANRDVEDDEERALKLGRAVYAARNVSLGILDPIHIPLDRSPGARHRKRVKTRRQRSGRIEDSSKRDVIAARISPVDCPKVSERVLSLDLHDVDLSA